MKRLILASIFCLAFAVVLSAQEKPPLQIIPPPNLLEFPPKLVNPSVGGTVRGLDLSKGLPAQAREIELKGINPVQSGVCSAPLLEARVEAVDPGMAFTPGNTTVPMPQARVPAPACQKK